MVYCNHYQLFCHEKCITTVLHVPLKSQFFMGLPNAETHKITLQNSLHENIDLCDVDEELFSLDVVN